MVNMLPDDLITDLARHGIAPPSCLADLRRAAHERGLMPPFIHSADPRDHTVCFAEGGEANADSLLVAVAAALVLTLDARASN